jgi:hypothetical protein
LPRSTKSLNGSLGQTSRFLLEIAHAKLVGAPTVTPPGGAPAMALPGAPFYPARGGSTYPLMATEDSALYVLDIITLVFQAWLTGKRLGINDTKRSTRRA